MVTRRERVRWQVKTLDLPRVNVVVADPLTPRVGLHDVRGRNVVRYSFKARLVLEFVVCGGVDEDSAVQLSSISSVAIQSKHDV